MTAEVSVMNRLGIALAADSAVTASSGTKGKIYVSAEKLFHISEQAPVGAMVYGEANLMGVPWETIIKSYRQCLGRATYPKLEDYVANFLAFLGDSKDLFPDVVQEQSVASVAGGFYAYLRDKLRRRLDAELKLRERDLRESEVRDIFSAVVEEELSAYMGFAVLDELPKDFAKVAEKTYGAIIQRARDEIFRSYPTSTVTSKSLTTLIIEDSTEKRYAKVEHMYYQNNRIQKPIWVL